MSSRAVVNACVSVSKSIGADCVCLANGFRLSRGLVDLEDERCGEDRRSWDRDDDEERGDRAGDVQRRPECGEFLRKRCGLPEREV